ncbi:MAG: RHS repeat-associated core domain-containing protein, partial [Nitrospirota bacterium]
VYYGTTSPGTLKVTITGTSYTPTTALTNDTVYYWKIVAKNAAGESTTATGAPQSFRTIVKAPAAFSLSAPSSGKTKVSTKPTFSWYASSRATSYDLYYGTTSPGTLQKNVTGTTYTPTTALTNNTVYYWKVVAKNAGGETISNYSPRSFTTIVSNPGTFNLTGPANGAIDVTVTPTFTWTASANATKYKIYYGTTSPPPYVTSVTGATQYVKTTSFSKKTKYYWNIEAVNDAGTLMSSTGPWNFTTLPAVPGSFSFSAPANNATNVSVTPALRWTASSNATSYEVYYGTTSPGTLQTTVTTTGYTPTTALAGNTKYYWQVIAKNSAGSKTITYAPRNFTTTASTSPPGAFNQTAPVNGASAAVKPTFTWGASSGATSYEVYYGTTSPGTLQATVTTTSYTPTADLQNGKTYYWQIIAKNANGSTIATGAPFIFTTPAGTIAAPGDFSLSAPTPDATDVSITPTFNWTTSAYATIYDVYYGETLPTSPVTSVTGTSYTITTPLPNNCWTGTTYSWKIIARNEGGEKASETRSFTTMRCPGPYLQLLPLDNAVNVSITPTLTWAKSTAVVSGDAASYEVYYGETLPSAPVTTVTTTSYAIPTALKSKTTYVWKIVAVNAGGKSETATRTFTTLDTNAPVLDSVTTIMYYDYQGNVTKTAKIMGGMTYTTEAGYDVIGRIGTATYPEGSIVYYTYNSNNGGLDKIGSRFEGDEYYKGAIYNDYGLVTSSTLGNNVTLQYEYNPQNFRLTKVKATNIGSQTVQELAYTYDNAGMVKGISDNLNSTNWQYTYDDVYHLTKARRGTGTTVGGGTEVYNKTYSYNTIGDIMKFEGREYQYGDSSHKHAVTSDGTNSYAYDENGNMTSGAGRTFTWNYDNKPASITKAGATTTFDYGANGERIKKQTGGSWKIYVGGMEKDQNGDHHIYITVGGATIKKKSDGSLYFILKDHLGGTSTILDSGGNIKAKQFYQPYGADDSTDALLNPDDIEDHKFTGQEEDTETGLYNYNARMYDPALGRFISADSVIGMNRYAYVSNNPVNRIDPSGYQARPTNAHAVTSTDAPMEFLPVDNIQIATPSTDLIMDVGNGPEMLATIERIASWTGPSTMIRVPHELNATEMCTLQQHSQTEWAQIRMDEQYYVIKGDKYSTTLPQGIDFYFVGHVHPKDFGNYGAYPSESDYGMLAVLNQNSSLLYFNNQSTAYSIDDYNKIIDEYSLYIYYQQELFRNSKQVDFIASLGNPYPTGGVPVSLGNSKPTGGVPVFLDSKPTGGVPVSLGNSKPTGGVPVSLGNSKPTGGVPICLGRSCR